MIGPVILMLQIFAQSSGDLEGKEFSGKFMPALFISISIPPNVSTVLSTIAVSSPWEVTSAVYGSKPEFLLCFL
eukprot:CAMPEP_0175003904 /NCGR_PEP_ID=MMETSP0005-20121125/4477_1 /TAXON_ID=420556 /ORGANISM="Ochromonas sp., Strain CCMP1393" /LENGTH=73 /DNA_ID=CAMNT_0016259011 /DNA_START=748 /DNA_END=969 /DNA_ORIENTATION=-